MKTTRKGAEQPIWILVAILLALIVGVMMYQFLNKGTQGQTFDEMMRTVDTGTAQLAVDALCTNWHNSHWVTEPADLERVSVNYGAKIGILTQTEWEAKELMTACDCAVYLYADKNAIQRSDVYTAAPDDTGCHSNMAAKYPGGVVPTATA